MERSLDTRKGRLRVDPAGVRQDDGEFIATAAVDELAGTQSLAEQSGDLGEEPIRSRLTAPRIRRPEIVDIEHAHG